MALPALDLREALMAAAQRIALTLHCDKVDAFLLDDEKQTLRAMGTSDTPMGRRQHALGLDVLPLANGGGAVDVFKAGMSELEPHADRGSKELRGIVVELGVRSTLNVPFDINGARRGVLSAVSAKPEYFTHADLQFCEVVARWVGMLAHRAELAERARRAEAEQARRAAADEIITVLAHDLRNHLHPLLSRLQLMRMYLGDGKALRPEDVDKAVRSVQRLSALTDDLLDVKRLDEGLFNLNLAPVDLVAIARDAAANLAKPSVTVAVNGPEALTIVGDGGRLRQALENLVANAVKYSNAGKEVQINLHRDPERRCATIEVLNEGPGISADVLPRLFDRFVVSADSSGLGLGLYLAQRIARVHHGDLKADSKPGGVTRFRLALPLEPNSEADEEEPTTREAARGRQGHERP